MLLLGMVHLIGMHILYEVAFCNVAPFLRYNRKGEVSPRTVWLACVGRLTFLVRVCL